MTDLFEKYGNCGILKIQENDRDIIITVEMLYQSFKERYDREKINEKHEIGELPEEVQFESILREMDKPSRD